jgi:hypothetical protein
MLCVCSFSLREDAQKCAGSIPLSDRDAGTAQEGALLVNPVRAALDAAFFECCLNPATASNNSMSRTSIAFWREKVVANRQRDLRVSRKLRRDGWKVLRVWECSVNEPRNAAPDQEGSRHSRLRARHRTNLLNALRRHVPGARWGLGSGLRRCKRGTVSLLETQVY